MWFRGELFGAFGRNKCNHLNIMQTINRSSVILFPKQPFIDWINSIDGPGDYRVGLDSFDSDHLSVFLVPDEYDSRESFLEDFSKDDFHMLFEEMLDGWYTDETFWPEPRTWAMFNDWFEIKYISVVFDLAEGRIEKEGF